MFKKLLLLSLLATLIAGPVSAYIVQPGDTISGLAKRFGISQQEIVQQNNITNPNRIFVGQSLSIGEFGIPEILGASRNYVEIPDSTLYSGAIVGDTTITLDQLVDIYGNSLTMTDFGDKGYGRINPEGSNISESFSFSGITSNSDGTKTLTGVKTVLAKSPYTETSGLVRSHGIGSTVRITNTAGFYNDFTNKNNFETIAKVWTFSALPESNGSLLATTTNQFVTKQYADNIAVQGAPTSTESVAGRVRLGTQNQMASSTYDANDPTVVYTRYTTSTPGTAGKYVPVTESDGKLNQTFIDLTDSYTWTGNHTFSNTQNTFSGSVNVSSTFQSTQPLTVFSATTSSTLPRVATDFISATSSGSNVTTTITNNLRVEGFVSSTQDFSRNLMATGQSSQAVNTTGNQVISHNLNFIPSLITIQAMARTDATSFGESYGTATSDLVDSVTYWGSDGANDTAGQVNNVIVSLRDGAGNIEATANLTAVTSNSFTLDWTTNSADGSSRFIQWVVYR